MYSIQLYFVLVKEGMFSQCNIICITSSIILLYVPFIINFYMVLSISKALIYTRTPWKFGRVWL